MFAPLQDVRKPARAAAAAAALALVLTLPLAAEIPLPDVRIYGKIVDRDGIPVIAGNLAARVLRAGNAALDVPGEFKTSDGAVWYLVRIPMETAIGAPGPSGAGARDGDGLAGLLLKGASLELSAPAGALKAGSILRIDAIAEPGSGAVQYIRGDCNPDLALDVSDAIRILTYMFIAPDPPPCLDACDSDGSKAIDITDPIHLLTFLFLTGTPPPAPGINCGFDPDPSELGCIQSICPSGP